MSEPVTEVLGPGGFQVGVGSGGSPADTRSLLRPPATPPTRPAPAPAPHGTPAPGEWVGRFEVERELGRGGAGVVLLARDRSLDRPVALKLLRADDAHTVARFRLEANALAGLTHPNAVRVYEFGDHAGRPYLAMEYVAGRSLYAALRDGPIDPRRAAGLVAAVAGAVGAAHAAGVVHRDVKPANVLLDAADAPKLSDFGVAKPLAGAAGLTQTNAVVGTPAYMAPEQAAGRAADARTDVYGLGATLYECLTGRPPFVGPALEVLKQVADDEPVPPGRLNRAVPRDLETVCLKCLDKDPARRYPSAAEVAADLGRVLRGEPVHARRTGAAERAVKWVRRHKSLAAMAAVAVASLVGGAAAAGWQAVRATAARDSEAGLRQFAEAKADEAAAFNRFLLDDLLRQASSDAQADGGFAAEPNLTVREALDRAAGKVGERFADRPAVAEAIRLALGNAYYGVGDYPKAVEQCRLALDSRLARLGPADPGTLEARHDLAVALTEAGHAAEAVPLLEECVRRRAEAAGPDDPETTRAVVSLTTAYHRVGRIAEGVAQLEAAYRAARDRLGPDHPDTQKLTGSLGAAYNAAGRPAEALVLLEEAFRLTQSRLGPRHPATLMAMGDLAQEYDAAGRAGEAIPMLEECLRLKRAELGADNPSTLISLSNLAAAYRSAGRTPEGLALNEECLRLRLTRLGPDHPDTTGTRVNLAQSYCDVRRPADAIALLETRLPAVRARYGPANPLALSFVNSLALSYNAAKRHADALPLHEECLKLRREHLGPAHPKTLVSLNNVATTQLSLGRPAEAVPALQECLTLKRGKLGAGHPDTLITAANLAACYDAVGRRPEAAALFEEVWRLRAAAVPADPQASAARGSLGLSLLRLGHYAEAEPHLLARYGDLQKGHPAPPELAARTRQRLAELYTKWGKPAEAANWGPPELAPPPRPARR